MNVVCLTPGVMALIISIDNTWDIHLCGDGNDVSVCIEALSLKDKVYNPACVHTE